MNDSRKAANALLSWRGYRTTSRAFDRWLREGSVASRWETAHRLDWLVWLRTLELGEHRPQLELLEDVGPMIVAAFEVVGERSAATDRVLELLAEERGAEAHARAQALTFHAISLLWPLTELMGVEPEEIDLNQPRELVTPAWVRVARESFRLLWSHDREHARAAQERALSAVRARGIPASWRDEREGPVPSELQWKIAQAAGVDRRGLVAALATITHDPGIDRATERELALEVVDAAARWAAGRATPWDVNRAYESAKSRRSGELAWGAFDAWRIGTCALLATRLWEPAEPFLDWADGLVTLAGPRRDDGWMRRLSGTRRQRGAERSLQDVLRCLGPSPGPEEEVPLVAWIAEASSDARAYFDPAARSLAEAWRDASEIRWMYLAAFLAGLDHQRWHRAIRGVAEGVVRRLGIEDDAIGAPEDLRTRAQRLARRASEVARDGSSWIEMRHAEPEVLLRETEAGDEEVELLRLAAQHHALRAIAQIAEDDRASELASPDRLDRAVVAWARSEGQDVAVHRRALCAELSEAVAWEEIEAASHDLPGPHETDAMALAGRAWWLASSICY